MSLILRHQDAYWDFIAYFYPANFNQVVFLKAEVLTILVLNVFIMSQSVFSQNGNLVTKGLFKVYKIDNSFADFHLIFIKNTEENYTIYSERSILVKGQQIKTGKEYYFELIRKIDTLVTGQVITPINYLDILYFGNKYSGTQTGMICYAKNLKGLITKISEMLTH
jgi:hypothetical protein